MNAVLDGVSRAADLKLADAAAAKADTTEVATEAAEDAELDALIGNVVSEGPQAADRKPVEGDSDSTSG